jgi:hypothetical protein
MEETHFRYFRTNIELYCVLIYINRENKLQFPGKYKWDT